MDDTRDNDLYLEWRKSYGKEISPDFLEEALYSAWWDGYSGGYSDGYTNGGYDW